MKQLDSNDRISHQEIMVSIVERLKKIDPLKIVLFGSYAYGSPHENSDVDLLVVTNDDFVPKTFSEKNAIYLGVSELLLDFKKSIPIDLIVHTKAMHRKFIELGSMFSKTIRTSGKVLYEKTD